MFAVFLMKNIFQMFQLNKQSREFMHHIKSNLFHLLLLKPMQMN
jgi:hypothetical protein